MTDDLPPPELYVPKPGSIAWKVLDHLVKFPNDELTAGDIAVKFGCVGGGVYTLMQLPVSRGALTKLRTPGEATWVLGNLKAFRLDPSVEQVQQSTVPASSNIAQVLPLAPTTQTVLTTAGPETVAAAPKPAPSGHQAVKVVQPLVLGSSETVTGNQEKLKGELPTKKVRAGVAEGPWALIDTANPPAVEPERPRPASVAMPLGLTPEMIEAVQKDPRTSFAEKADGHHAIGWLHDAYRVIVETQRNQPAGQ
ncbi:MAG: hypothetical protein V4718_04395 [Pseudomonadota bacterium]